MTEFTIKVTEHGLPIPIISRKLYFFVPGQVLELSNGAWCCNGIVLIRLAQMSIMGDLQLYDFRVFAIFGVSLDW